MATYVLLHGAWAGGWMWREVATRLQQAGHQAFTPTLTGLGERVHLANPDVDLNTHIQDVVNVLFYEDLKDVILVGYSSAGIVATGVAELAADRIGQLVYLDALIVQDGQSVADIAGPELMGFLEEAAEAHGNGWLIPPDPSSTPRHTAQPLKPFQQPLSVSNPDAAQLPHAFILCTRGAEDVGPLHTPVSQAAKRLKADDSWGYQEIDTGHMPMWTHPQELTELLLQFS